MNDGGFIDMINSFFGGAVTTLIGAFTGRLMWHSGEVKVGNRRFFGKELLWETRGAAGPVSSPVCRSSPSRSGAASGSIGGRLCRSQPHSCGYGLTRGPLGL